MGVLSPTKNHETSRILLQANMLRPAQPNNENNVGLSQRLHIYIQICLPPHILYISFGTVLRWLGTVLGQGHIFENALNLQYPTYISLLQGAKECQCNSYNPYSSALVYFPEKVSSFHCISMVTTMYFFTPKKHEG